MANVPSSKEAGEEGVVEKNYEKPSVYLLWNKEPGKPFPEEEVEKLPVMANVFVKGIGFRYGAAAPEKLMGREKLKETGPSNLLELAFKQLKEKLKEKGSPYESERDSRGCNPYGYDFADLEKTELQKENCPYYRFENDTLVIRDDLPPDDEFEEIWEKRIRLMYGSEESDDEGFLVNAQLTRYNDIRDNEWLNDLCREAVAEFNHNNESDYEFVEVKAANRQPCAGTLLLVTFQARRKSDYDSLVAFHARVHRCINPTVGRVISCRLERDAGGPIDNKLDQETKSDSGAQVDAAAAVGPQGMKSEVLTQD